MINRKRLTNRIKYDIIITTARDTTVIQGKRSSRRDSIPTCQSSNH